MFDESDEELQDTSRGHPLDESHRVTLRYDTEKHINPRTGEVIDGAKPAPEKNPLSYDVQNIEPVAPANVVRRYGVKEEGSSHSSAKDSAYGSIEGKVNTTSTTYRVENKQITNIEKTYNNSPSRSLSGSSIPNRSPMSTHAQRIQKTEEVFSKEIESVKGSCSTLHSVGNSSRSNSLQISRNGSLDNSLVHINNVPPQNDNVITASRPHNPVVTQNGFSPGPRQPQSNLQTYTSLKDSPYDTVRNEPSSTTDSNSNIGQATVQDSPYTSMMNIVQGQIKISPHSSESNRNVVNVSVTNVNRNKKK